MKEKVEEAIKKVRSMLQADGGDIDLIDVTQDGVVQVKLRGACGSCPMSQRTLKEGIERFIKKEIPDIKEVVAV